KVADRIIMLYPLFRLGPDEPQIVFTGTPEELDRCDDPRIRQFVEGQAGNRLTELQEEQALQEPTLDEHDLGEYDQDGYEEEEQP
ncbi:MAG: hypothetical protein ACKOHK_05585, partial [Planctomycetia bacterium]